MSFNMMTLFKIFISMVLGLISLVLFVHKTMAQCAMCRATVENNVSSGESGIGAGLNAGILYLFAVPYLLFAVIAFFWYRSSKANKKNFVAS